MLFYTICAVAFLHSLESLPESLLHRRCAATRCDKLAANYPAAIDAHRPVFGSVPMSPRLDFYEAAAPTACLRAGGVQRNAAPNRFQTLIEATADVR